MATVIQRAESLDIRFPTSRARIGSDATNPDPDYSAAYVMLHTSDPSLVGHGHTFTIGRGTEICVAAIDALASRVVGLELEAIAADMAGFWRHLTGDSQIRWLGPEKGVVHLASAALANAVWDLWAKREGKPLWQLLCDLGPAGLAGCIDFRYLTDDLTSAEAVELLERAAPGRDDRAREIRELGLPAYTTSVGWLGYPDEQVRSLCRAALKEGWTRFKLKVGADLADDLRRTALVRAEVGDDALLLLDANQRWDVGQAIAWMRELAPFRPHWIEEPTSPDDVLGHAAIARAVAPIAVATGEHVQNRVVFKQLLLLEAIGYCQVDACRLGGVNEALAVILHAAKYGVPVCPHTGGVGLGELHQHLSFFDYICLGGELEARFVESTDHLHEHFVDPVRMRGGRYRMPERAGTSVEMHQASRASYRFGAP